MNRVAQSVVVLCMVVTPVHAQQVGSVDLSRRNESPESTRKQENTALPKGCEKLLPGMIGDGAALPPNHEPREIVVEMVKLSNENPVTGSEVQGNVQLRNSGQYAITIPWSTDPNIIEKGQNSNRLQWEEGHFDIELKRSYELLVNLSQSLYGSRFSAGSELTIQPGEWVTAFIKFKLTSNYATSGKSVRKGKRDLYVEWEQSRNSKGIRNCAVTTGWFHYRNYYRQQNPTITINVN
jgi:hypothetical protein